MVPNCPAVPPSISPTTLASPEQWRGVLLSVVSAKTGTRYEGVLCHVDDVEQRVFLGDVQRVGGEGRHAAHGRDLSDKLLVISRGQLESIKIVGDEEEEEEEEDESDWGRDGEEEEESSVTALEEEEEEYDEPELCIVDLPADDGATEAVDVVDDCVLKSFKAALLQQQVPVTKVAASQTQVVPAAASLGGGVRIKLPMTRWMIKQCPRLFPDYCLPDDIAKILEHRLEDFESISPEERETLNFVRAMIRDGISASSYKYFLTFLLFAEEFQLEQTVQNYDMHNVKVKKRPPNHPVCLKVPGLVDKNPNVIKGDTVCLYVSGEWYDLVVMETYHDEVHFERDEIFESAVFWPKTVTERICDVQFTVNQSTLRCMHRAIGILHTYTIARLFPEKAPCNDRQVVRLEDMVLYNPTIKNNDEQMQAIHHIVCGSSWPYPYILFGPPGTGKTVTVVEAIMQVWKLTPGSRIIVSAPSNTAVDLLAARLIDVIPEKEILRLVAPARENVEVDANIEEIIVYGRVRLEKLLSFRVVCVTLSTSGRLFSSGIAMGHFTHVFIDEAGQATEPESIVPLAGLLGRKGHIVLSGDPNQLGPVNMSDLAKKHGLDTSLMERLMKTSEIYSRDASGNRNPDVITKLLRNFRSHAKLLTLPSRLFYDNELIACAPLLEVGSLCNLEWLPKKGFPIIFHGVVHKHKKGNNSTSLFNDREVEQVIKYVAKLTTVRDQNSIGIVSPYKRQVRMIKEELSSQLQLTDLLVGSTEEFQGQERDVMIVSTVRSSVNDRNGEEGGGLGFLVHPKRFNVAITRAKALMIVVGDPFLLKRDKHWRELLKYAWSEGGYTGCNFNYFHSNKNKKGKQNLKKP